MCSRHNRGGKTHVRWDGRSVTGAESKEFSRYFASSVHWEAVAVKECDQSRDFLTNPRGGGGGSVSSEQKR